MNVSINVRDSSSGPNGPTTDANGTLSLPPTVQGVTLIEVFPGMYTLSAGSPAAANRSARRACLHANADAIWHDGHDRFSIVGLRWLQHNEGLYDFGHRHGSALDHTPCFCRGTLILTERGERPVEELAIGDRLMTSSGAISPISWIGRTKVTARLVDPLRSWPIRIKANALAEGVPSRDMLLSPDHAVFVDGILIQAGALVNDTSIVHETDVPDVFDYYHIELDDHTLIIANNVRSETFIDNVDRLAFDNWKEHEALYPDGKPIVEMPCPRAKSNRQVPRMIREMLAERGIALYGAPLIASAA